MSRKAILFSTRFIGKSKYVEEHRLFEEAGAMPFESKTMCDFFNIAELKSFFPDLTYLKNNVVEAGYRWEQDYDNKTGHAIIKELSKKGCAHSFIQEQLAYLNAELSKIDVMLKTDLERNPSSVIQILLEHSGEVAPEGIDVNIGIEDGIIKQRFQIYELPPTSEHSVFAVWNLKHPCLDRTWENALCEEIIQRGQREGYTYSDIYLFLHDKDIFTKEQTFGVKESHVYQNSTIHVAYFKHEYPDPVKSLLEKKGMSPDSVAKHAIELMSLPNLEKIKSLLNKGVINWDAIMTFVEKLPEEEKVKQLFIKENAYRGKELSEIKKKVKTRINEIQSIDEK